MNTIGPLLVTDMKQRLITERRLGTIESKVVSWADQSHVVDHDMVAQIGKCKTMSDINQLLCNYHFLFSDEKDRGKSVVSVDGTQEYVIGLLTERISGGYPKGYPSRAGEKIIMHYGNEFPPADHDFGTQTRLGDSSDWDQVKG